MRRICKLFGFYAYLQDERADNSMVKFCCYLYKPLFSCNLNNVRNSNYTKQVVVNLFATNICTPFVPCVPARTKLD